MSNKVLMTGATGFIGSHLMESLLAEGFEVKAAVRPSSRVAHLEDRGIEIQRVDFADEASWREVISDCQTVYHLAGAVAGSRRELLAANRDATSALAASCSKMPNPPKLVLVSSLSAAGPSFNNVPRDAGDPPQPTSEYGKSKLAGEVAALAHASAMPITIVRPGIVFGPRDTEFVKLLAPIVRWGVNPMAGYHDPEIGFVHVEDLVLALRNAADRGANCSGPLPHSNNGRGVYFVIDPGTLTLEQLGRLAGKAVGRNYVLNMRFPLAIAAIAASAASVCSRAVGRRSTFNPDKIREAAAPGWTCNVSPTMRDLGWQPLCPLPERLSQVARKLV